MRDFERNDSELNGSKNFSNVVLLISATVCRRCAVVISKDFSCPIFTEDQARCINKFLNIQNHIQAYTALN